MIMMMRQIVTYLMAALTCTVFVSTNPAFCAITESSDLAKLVSEYHDDRMTVNDLAFFLASHNFDATPKEGYVQVKIDGSVYKVMPNGTNPGLADILIMN
jgi:hypothetical protein